MTCDDNKIQVSRQKGDHGDGRQHTPHHHTVFVRHYSGGVMLFDIQHQSDCGPSHDLGAVPVIHEGNVTGFAPKY